MRIGVLGSGAVAQTLAAGLSKRVSKRSAYFLLSWSDQRRGARNLAFADHRCRKSLGRRRRSGGHPDLRRFRNLATGKDKGDHGRLTLS